MDSLQIRKKFFDFFKKYNHVQIPSSSLIPAQDPTLLFTNAGMNQFKDDFLGIEQPNFNRAVTIQKCIRAGGKHNDLENVGFTKRHLTFFEMLGNFSFGDYFKKEAIKLAWEFLTAVLNFDQTKLFASVYYQDDEAYNIWQKIIGLPESQIVKLGDADNFWQMGEVGPCGPCSEIYIDRGKECGCKEVDCGPGCSCDRFLEIWNLVFMQYDKQPDGSFKPLKQTGVDTGMGLERLCAIIQDKDTIFETDIFSPLISQIEKLTQINYQSSNDQIKGAFRVLADHVRSTSFAIADGALPSNEGRGYVLRKIIRRASLFSQKLGDQFLLSHLVPVLAQTMSQVYPELKENQDHIIKILNSEIERFAHNLQQGQAILEKYFEESSKNKIITGEQAFKLYDTYGFPLELTKVIALEKGYSVNIQEFEKFMAKQKIKSGKKEQTEQDCPLENIYTHFTGYDEHLTNSTIIALIKDNQSVDKISSGDTCYVITEHSPFYVECGGQVSDQGYITVNGKKANLEGLKKFGKAIGTYIQAPDDLQVGKKITLVVDSPSRINTMKNHTATHLLQAALMEILGKHVKQSGSLVAPDYLRFDFTYSENLSTDQITAIENLVNKKILENIPVRIDQTTLKQAQERGVIAHFGEKYNPECVRVVDIAGFSQELCGGTHVKATGDIGLFKITEVLALSAGNRRLVAVTGFKSLELFQNIYNTHKQASKLLNKPVDQILNGIEKLIEQNKENQQILRKFHKQALESNIEKWLSKKESVKNLPFLFLEVEQEYSQDLRLIAQALAEKSSGLYFVTSKAEDKILYTAIISPDLSNKINFKELSNWLKDQGFKGGGKDNIIQGQAENLDKNFKEKLMEHISEII